MEPSPETKAVLRHAVGRQIARWAPASADPNAAAERADAEPAAAAAPFARLSVLVVEDHPFQRRTALALLRGLGVGTLIEASDGNEALELLAGSAPPDIIICDIDMPGMDGVEFIRRVAQRGLASAIAIASALERRLLNAIQSVSEGYGLQVLGSVEKPLTARRLRELLEAYRAPPPRDEARDHAEMSAPALSDAVAHERIVADLQPIVDLASGRVSAVQVVARWQQPAGPAIEQDAFEHLLADDLATRFLERLVALLCAQLHALDRAGDSIDAWISIPGDGLVDPALADRLVEQVRACGGDPRRIVCALSAPALQREGALHALTRLRVMGFGVCLDDFASAHWTDQQLQRIPFTAVRLAEHVICGAHADPARVEIVQDAIDVARGLDVPVVAGGCATGADFELLLELGCDFGQGTVIAPPMAAPRVADWAASWTPPLPEDRQ